MKNKIISIILLSASLSITGCGTEHENVEPTEVVMETETEEVAVETETGASNGEAVDGSENTVVEDVGGSGEAYKIYSDALIVNEDGTYDFTESFIGGLMSYDFFAGCNEEEVRDYVKSNDTFKILLIDGTPELIDGFINSVSMNGEITLKQLLGQNDTSNSNTSSNKGNNTNSNKGNSSSTSNNTGNTAGSQSNTNSSTTESGSGNITTPPADTSSDQGMDDMTKAALEAAGVDTDASNLGNEGHTDYNNTIQ